MRYPGGKSRFAGRIVDAMTPWLTETFVEPFVGGFNMVPALPDGIRPLCSDLHPGIICLYNYMKAGWTPPNKLTCKEYYKLYADCDWTNPMTAFASFGASFNALEWANFHGDGTLDVVRGTHNHLMRSLSAMKRARFRICPYQECNPPPGSVVYLDPPYRGRSLYSTEESRADGYRGYVREESFDHDAFYEWIASLKDVTVFVSEYALPTIPFEEVWRCPWKKTEQQEYERLFRIAA
jgi:site-specific DNA-adenine methylase